MIIPIKGKGFISHESGLPQNEGPMTIMGVFGFRELGVHGRAGLLSRDKGCQERRRMVRTVWVFSLCGILGSSCWGCVGFRICRW